MLKTKKDLAEEIRVLCSPLHGIGIQDDGNLEIVINNYMSLCVEAFISKKHTRIMLGYLGVKDDTHDGYFCYGMYYDYSCGSAKSIRIDLKADTSEEIVKKFIHCLAPIIRVENWENVRERDFLGA